MAPALLLLVALGADLVPADAGKRLLWGVGLIGGGASDQFAVGTDEYAGPGVYGRLGMQGDDDWGGEAEVSAGFLFFVAEVRGALTVDFTPTDLFTFAIGPTAREDFVFSRHGPPAVMAESVGGTVRLDFHLMPERIATGRRALTIGVVGDLGATVGGDAYDSTFNGPEPAYGLFLTIGWAHY